MANDKPFLDIPGLTYLWGELKKKFATITHSHDNATTSKAGFMSKEDKSKLDGVATGANKYSHPTYTAKSSGLYKVTVDGTGHVSGATAVQKSDITGLGIPAQDTTYSAMTGASSSAAGKTGLVPAPAAGKQGSFLRGDGTWASPANTTYSAATQSAAGLMSAEDKTKLDGVASGANAYTHPSYTARTGKPTANATPAFGGTFTVSQIKSDASGHVTAATDRTITIPSTTATTSAAGLMSASDKSKLDGIAAGANAYSHPASHPATMITGLATVATSGSYNDLSNKPTIPAAVTVDSALSSTSTNPVQNKVVNAALEGKAETGHKHTGLAAVTTSGTGAAYTATVDGITSLTKGVNFIMIPHTSSTTTAPTLNVNGLGAKTIQRMTSSNDYSAAGYNASWLQSTKPVHVIYSGNYWYVQSMSRPAAYDLRGTVPIESGGTGATTADEALTNLGLKTEPFVFTLEDGSTVTKEMYVK